MLWTIACPAQKVEFGAAYAYLYATQWDKAIQTYNFARPFKSYKQPLLHTGGAVYGAYLFPKGKVKKGVCLTYAYYSSSSTNAAIATNFNLHTLKPSFFIRTIYKKKLSADLALSLLTGALTKRVNGEQYIYRESNNTAFAIGACLGAKLTYRCLRLNERCALAPYVEASYTPYVYTPNFEPLLNQTRQLASKPHSSLLGINCGIILGIK